MRPGVRSELPRRGAVSTARCSEDEIDERSVLVFPGGAGVPPVFRRNHSSDRHRRSQTAATPARNRRARRVCAGSNWGGQAQGERASRPFLDGQHGRDARAPCPNQKLQRPL
jgi:hypothetical protein